MKGLLLMLGVGFFMTKPHVYITIAALLNYSFILMLIAGFRIKDCNKKRVQLARQ